MRHLILSVGLVLCAAVLAGAAEETFEVQRARAAKAMKDGNWKDAYDVLSKLCLEAKNTGTPAATDLHSATQCLNQLGRTNELDDLWEKSVAAHTEDWRVLFAAGQCYAQTQHQGFIVAGKFERGHHRGGGEYANSFPRDRARAMQLYQQCLALVQKDADRNAAYQFYWQFAEAMLQSQDGAWRLQDLTDLKALPDYEKGYYYGRGGQQTGAPVKGDGTPVFHALPKSWEAAASDGERWRWLLMQAQEAVPANTSAVLYHFASFLRGQFDVQTMAYYGRWWSDPGDDAEKKDESGTFAVKTLGENETIARLACGVRRFALPDEFNFIKIYQRLATEFHHNQSLHVLGQIFEDRQQYDKAVDYWRKAGQAARVQQILGNWGVFEPLATQPAGQGPVVPYRFRNGKKVSFTACEVDVAKLLADLKAYIKSAPQQLDWQRVDLGEIGYGLVERGRQQYVGKQVAAWDLELQPRPAHFDRRVSVATPLQKPGAYLLTAQMEGGNATRILVWVADTVIVKKPLNGQTFYYVADAVTGQPVPIADLQLFGYRQEWKGDGRKYEMKIDEQAVQTDADGQYFQKADPNQSYQYLATATTKEGRLAFLGWTYVWHGQWYDAQYQANKVYVITDRPVYRPGQTVKYKIWVGKAQYDQPIDGASPFARQNFSVELWNPKGEKGQAQGRTADEFGGFDGEFALPKDATLGVYSLTLPDWGGGHFRVEEYKKPEFEVKVEAPKEPVMLGEKIAATIQAKYYFGAPVTEGKLKYKIQRFNQTANWYPMAYWDWFYGRGYWWFACDYPWYPGFKEWGCCRPWPWWWGVRQQPPELVAEAEGAIGKDGILKVEIDTALAKAMHGDTDHRYEIVAEVTDQSRRTIVGTGQVLVARKPFRIYSWVDHGYYKVGDAIHAEFQAQTLDQKPVQGSGALKLLKVSYDKDLKPVEAEVEKWALDTNPEGRAHQQIKAGEPGQYRLSYRVKDAKGHEIEGGYVFTVTGAGFDGSGFRFNDLELIPDKREYNPKEQVNLQINTNRAGAAVLLFLRPANGIYLPPKVLRLKDKSVLEAVEITKKDMPNFFVEAFTVAGGKVHSETREIIVPPEERVLNVAVEPSAKEYLPGVPAKVKLKLTELNGEPYRGSAVVSIYDKAVEYISGGSNVPEIKEFFWKWRRHHSSHLEASVLRGGNHIAKGGEAQMGFLGVFGHLVADLDPAGETDDNTGGVGGGFGGGAKGARDGRAMKSAAPRAAMGMEMAEKKSQASKDKAADEAPGEPAGAPAAEPMVQPTVRTQFADTAFWKGDLKTALDGTAEIELKMPENLTTWKVKVWAMGGGTRVGQAETEIITTKNLIIRLQAPRFFVQKDEVVLSANVHNYLKTTKKVKVALELDGPCLAPFTPADLAREIEIEPKGEKRVDWRVKVACEGEAVVRMKALTDEESDAMEQRFPVYVHGMLKMDSYAGTLRPEKESASVTFNVPQERRPEASRLEVRYSPTLAGAMVDALPYLCEYPYGCTEQTLSRFLPTVITQKVIQRTGIKLKDIRDKLTNLNAQEIGNDVERAKQWKRYARNPVFDEGEVAEMVVSGVTRLTNMQLSDGGWGWFSGYGEQSYPHTTAYVVHGFQIARANDVQIQGGVLERGVEWLKRYQAIQVQMLKNAPTKTHPWKELADNLDAFVYMVLGDAKIEDAEMREFLYRDRNHLAVYGKSMFGLALHRQKHVEQRDMLMQNIEQFLVQDAENETAYLKLPEDNWWWYWYGSEYEAQAYYLKLLSDVDPKGEKAPRLVKYLLNNRKHATYWKSTRDTAVCIEAFADYLKASGEDKPEMTLEISLDGKKQKEVEINASNLFTFDNTFLLTGANVPAGEHKIEFRRKGKGPLYFNAYVTNFTLEDDIKRAGLEIKVDRKYYRLERVEKTGKVAGAEGQVVAQKEEKYERHELKNLAELKSGQLVEVELEIESKNDYEYILFEDMKAAGFEPVEVRSGYTNNAMHAYVEFRDERVCFFVHTLARGKHSVAYRLRAEIPGQFSALPTRASAMYAPELKGNSDEIKLRIQD